MIEVSGWKQRDCRQWDQREFVESSGRAKGSDLADGQGDAIESTARASMKQRETVN